MEQAPKQSNDANTSGLNCIGFAIIKGLPNLVGHKGETDEPAAVMADSQGHNKQFMTEKVLAERIEALQDGSPIEKAQANQFRAVLGSLQFNIASGSIPGPPIADASQFKPTIQLPAQPAEPTGQSINAPRTTFPRP